MSTRATPKPQTKVDCSFELSTMSDTKQKCVPQRRVTCPGGCFPGQCLNARCKVRLYDPAVICHPNLEREAELRRHCIEIAKKDYETKQRLEFLKEERRKMGMESFMKLDAGLEKKIKESHELQNRQCPKIDFSFLKTPDGATKTMREPARPSCMLDPPPFTPPTDDYNDLSRFLRISTMPGYSGGAQISEYHGNHNMDVWDNRREIDPQSHKMKRDWLSVWGEFNVKEQRWRKAWMEKFGV